MTEHIFHIARAVDWERAQAVGRYEVSTIGRTLAEEGFIHAAFEGQWAQVFRSFYADLYEPLLLLEIDPALLTSVVVHEQPAPGVEAIYPHIYGPIDTDAVVRTYDITRAAPASYRSRNRCSIFSR